jgi:hypothetical protein
MDKPIKTSATAKREDAATSEAALASDAWSAILPIPWKNNDIAAIAIRAALRET